MDKQEIKTVILAQLVEPEKMGGVICISLACFERYYFKKLFFCKKGLEGFAPTALV